MKKIINDKDEEIKELGEIVQQYLIPSKNYDAIIRDKDEEIKVLECRAYHAEGYINDLHNNPKDKKFYDKKARSIVAMLFWEWRKSEARIYATNIKWNTGRAFQSQILFEAAYKMLKEKS